MPARTAHVHENANALAYLLDFASESNKLRSRFNVMSGTLAEVSALNLRWVDIDLGPRVSLHGLRRSF